MADQPLNIQAKYSQSAVVEFWTRFAESGLQAAETAMLARYAPAPPTRILDIGCGAGRVTLALQPQGYRVVGLDITGAMLRAARGLAVEHGLDVAFAQGDLCELPFAAEGFDVAVIFIAALQHVVGRRSRQAALAQVAGALKKDGVLILALDNIAPALSCYASWAFQRMTGRLAPSGSTALQSQAADAVLAAGRQGMSGLGWRARGLARSLRWRTWEGARDVGRALGLIGGERGDTLIAQVSMPPTAGKVYYHLYRHDELVADAKVAGFQLLGYHSGNELAERRTFRNRARQLDKQVLYALAKAF